MPGTRSAHLQMGVLAGIEAIDADLEIGATNFDPRLLQEAQRKTRSSVALMSTRGRGPWRIVDKHPGSPDNSAGSGPRHPGRQPLQTIGLLGGMTCESSVEYYRLINEEVRRQLGGIHSAQSLMFSVDFGEIQPEFDTTLLHAHAAVRRALK